MLTFKFVTEEFLSPGGYGTLDYSGSWPKEIETEVDSVEEGQCARGIHVIPLVDNPDFTNAVWTSRIIILDVDEQDIVFSQDNGKMRVRKATVLREAITEEINQIRATACKDPESAYYYARDIDKSPRDDTRQAACQNAAYAYRYAINIDKSPRDDTREAAYKHPYYDDLYALHFHKCSSNI